jgi:hypothetical protein
LDPNEGDKYNELVVEDAQISIMENAYKILGCKEYYVNPTTNGEMSRRSVHSCDTNSKNAMNRW